MRSARGLGAWQRQSTGSRTALARSGRDGRVIWKTTLDSGASWFEHNRGGGYLLTAFPLPGGDLNGDGTPDVAVQQYVQQGRAAGFKHAATLPIQVLSGRNGDLLWRAGPLPLGFDAQGYSQIESIHLGAVDAAAGPDLFVRHGSPFVKPGSSPLNPPPGRMPLGARLAGRPNLARISGRDGRILWDVTLAEGVLPPGNPRLPLDQFGDLDGDGGLDTLVVLPPIPSAGQPDSTLLAVSLRDGKRLWSQPLRFPQVLGSEMCIGDLHGDGHRDVIVMEELPESNGGELQVRAFNGRDGELRWTWSSPADLKNNRPRIVLANLAGNGTRNVCVSFKEIDRECRTVVLDGAGKERVLREVTGDYSGALLAADLGGDGRDELLVWAGDRLRLE